MADTPTAQTTARVQRFSYTSFGGNTPEKEVQPVDVRAAEKKPVIVTPAEPTTPPPPPAITEQDLQAARSEAHAKGYAEGVATTEAKLNKEAATREESVRGLLEVIANRITIGAETHTSFLKQQEAVMGQLILAIARKVCGDALKAQPLTHVEALLRECMALVAGQAKIVIMVSPVRSVDLKRKIDTIKQHLQGFEGELVIEENAELGDEDCRVEWKDGYGVHDGDAVWKSIETIIAQKTIVKEHSEGDAHG